MEAFKGRAAIGQPRQLNCKAPPAELREPSASQLKLRVADKKWEQLVPGCTEECRGVRL